MYHLSSVIPNHSSIKNIIFDFGGVICDLDISLTEKKFRDFGPSKNQNSDSGKEFHKLVERLETGKISPDQFRKTIRDHYVNFLSDQDIDEAWNAMLLFIPDHRIQLLQQIKTNYKTYLLSNSNQIHYECYLKNFREQIGLADFTALFEKTYFSFLIGLKKPGREIYDFVLSDSSLNPTETLFIDDTLENVEGAEAAGINSLFLKEGKEIADLFTNYGSL